MKLMGYPFDYHILKDLLTVIFRGTLTTITLWGHPHDYDIMRDTKDNDIDGVLSSYGGTLTTIRLWSALPSWL